MDTGFRQASVQRLKEFEIGPRMVTLLRVCTITKMVVLLTRQVSSMVGLVTRTVEVELQKSLALTVDFSVTK